ncbi:sugar transferase [bacterium]|nr:sugar transferase [bacterium]
MSLSPKRESLVLLLGDIVSLVLALWLALFLRALDVPSAELFLEHLFPFSLLFIAWISVFFISGLYGKHTLFFKSRLPSLLLRAQLANTAVAALFFYTLPYFTIAPKTILVLAVVLSFLFILLWRTKIVSSFGFRHRARAILIGSGEEKNALLREVRGNARYPFTFIFSINPDNIEGVNFEQDILKKIYEEKISVIVLDFGNEKLQPFLPHFYHRLFAGVRFLDANAVYEDIFDRVPIGTLGHTWVLKNISGTSRKTYDALKRAMDISISCVVGTASLLLYPFVYIAIKLDDGGPVFITQERVGQGGRSIKIHKFRSMQRNEIDLSQGGSNAITRVGKILRLTRLDEIPQLWSVVRGDLSLIGPRPELPSGVLLYEKEIPYYGVRHLIKPGLSGWAQLYHDNHPHHSAHIEATREKLSYDLYYIKHRSLTLDIKIALFTIKTLLSRSGV